MLALQRLRSGREASAFLIPADPHSASLNGESETASAPATNSPQEEGTRTLKELESVAHLLVTGGSRQYNLRRNLSSQQFGYEATLHSIIEFLTQEGPKYLLGALIALFVEQIFRSWRKKRLSIEPGCLPSFTMTFKEGKLEARVFGKYSVLNLSDLPVNLIHYNFLLYNAASRALQFNLAKANVPLENWFRETVIPPNTETVLVGETEWLIGLVRCWARRLPVFLWLEVLGHARIGSRSILQYKATLYVLWGLDKEANEAMYRATGLRVGARLARTLAGPGKLLHRRKGRDI